jgi:hypothetical protein
MARSRRFPGFGGRNLPIVFENRQPIPRGGPLDAPRPGDTRRGGSRVWRGTSESGKLVWSPAGVKEEAA